MFGWQPFERAEQCPLVGRGLERRRLEEDTRPGLTAPALERQCDQVPEPLVRQEVLIRKQPVVACEVELPAACHRLAQKERPEPPRRSGRHRHGEEDPRVSAVTGTTPLQHRRNTLVGTGLEKRRRVELPRSAVQVTGKEPASVVLEQRIDTERLTAPQMLLDRLVGQVEVRLRATADPAPAAGNRGHITALSGAGVLPAARINILTATKETPDQRDLLGR